MQEILPGVWHWTTVHPNLGQEVSSYWLAKERVLLNPLRPTEGADRIADPQAVVLTNRHHLRDAEAFGVAIHAPATGLDDLPDGVQGYADGDDIGGLGLRAHAVFADWPDEFAVEIPSVRALALADGAVREGDGPLVFVPEQYMDEPEEEKRGLAEGLGRIAERVDFDALLPSHGDPIAAGGREALREFAATAG
jgi:hypothetical protein